MKIGDLTKNEIEVLLNENGSIKQILNSLNVNHNGSGAYQIFKRRCELFGLEPKCKGVRNDKGNPTKIVDAFVKDSKYTNRTKLKQEIIKKDLIEYKCSIEACGISEWLGERISLHLDHINGINNDNRLENLRFLCPNCHSQTETFSGRNKKSKEVDYRCGSESDN